MTNVVTTATPDTECGKHVEYLSSQATPRSPSKLGSDPCNPPEVDSKSDISVGDERRGVKDTIELPMPAIQSSCTLRHAEVTLQLCSNRLKQHLRKLLESNLSSVGAIDVDNLFILNIQFNYSIIHELNIAFYINSIIQIFR